MEDSSARTTPGVPYRVREADSGDSEALRRLEARCPLKIGQTRVTTEHAHDLLVNTTLQEDVRAFVCVNEREELVGAISGARHRALIGGTVRTVLLVQRARILPHLQSSSLGTRLANTLYGAFATVGYEAHYCRVSPGNVTSEAWLETSAQRWVAWKARALLGLLPVGATARGLDVEVSTPETLTPAVSMINRHHREEELFFPYSTRTFEARLRAYGYDSNGAGLVAFRSAVLAMAPSFEKVTTTTDRSRETSVRAAVLDFGFVDEEDFEKLLAVCCARLPHTVTHLSVATSTGSRSAAVLERLGATFEESDIWVSGLVEPPTTCVTGIYVDRVYY